MNNSIKSIVLMLLGLVAGIAATTLFHHTGNPGIASGPKLEQPATIQAASKITEAHYQGKLDSLAAVNEQLGKEASITKSAIRQQQYNYKVLDQLVDTLISHANTETDTATRLQECDSLTIAVTDMMSVTARKDSLYDSLVTTLQVQATAKDEGVQLQRQAYNALKLSFEQTIAQADVLNSKNLLLEQQIHRQAIKNKVLSTGIILLTGCLAYSVIRH